MKILFLSTLKRKVTAHETASRSQIIYQLAKGLAEKGHTVSLIGTGDSIIPGVNIIPVTDKGWRDLPSTENEWYREIATLMQAIKLLVAKQHEYDIIHNHLFPEFVTPIIENELSIPMVTTLHSQATDYMDRLLAEYTKSYFVALSQAHRKMFTKASIQKVIYNGIDIKIYAFEPEKQDYLLWIGRITNAKNEDGSYLDPKGVRHAIQLAQKTGQRLFLSGSVHGKDMFAAEVQPFLNDKIQWIGDTSEEQPLVRSEIIKLMQGAKALLMTINWEEPFGLVMAEAMSCGTPVIGFDRGSVAEVVKNGETGFVVDPKEGVEGLEKALEKISSIDPKKCRDHVEKNFSMSSMIDGYEKLYLQMIRT